MDPKAGGVSQAVRTMIKGLNDLNTTNAVVCLNPPDSNFLKESPFEVFALGIGKTAWNFNVGLNGWLKFNLNQYDVAILHGLWQYQSHALLKTRRYAKQTRIFVMPHGMLDPYFQRAPDRKLKAIRNLFFWNLIERRIIEKASGLLFTCETEKLLARETFKRYYPRKELVVGLGVEPPPPFSESLVKAFLSNYSSQLNTRGYLLYISRIHPKKGLDLLLDAYLKLKADGFQNLPSLIIAGPGLESDYGKHIQQLAINEPRIIFTGMLSGNLKWGAFYGCEAFILPSHQENFGIAVVEALACKKPVLISNQVNIWREIYEEGAGMVTNNNREGVTELLTRWLDLSVDRRRQMERMAIRTYHEYFTVEVAANRLKKALQLADGE